MVQAIPLQRLEREAPTTISHFLLPGLLIPGQKLAINLETRTLSLLTDGPQLLREQQFSVNEMNVLFPIFESYPHYCPYEVLLAHLSTDTVTSKTITRCRQRLNEAKNCGRWHQELRPIRRALSSLRSKLYDFRLEISNIRERGCNLTSLKSEF